MPVVVFMKWDGVTPSQYNALRDHVNWEKKTADGGIVHVAAFTEKGARVTDVWESAAAFETFVEKRLMPGVAVIGIKGEPNVEIYPLHRLFTPGLEPVHVV